MDSKVTAPKRASSCPRPAIVAMSAACCCSAPLERLKDLLSSAAFDGAQQQISGVLDDVHEQIHGLNCKKESLESLVVVMKQKIDYLEEQQTAASAAQENASLTVLPPVVEKEFINSPVEDALRAKVTSLENEKNEFAHLLERKNTEISNLNEEIKRLTEKNKSIWESFCKADENLGECRSKLMSSQVMCNSLEQEIGRFEKLSAAKEAEIQNTSDAFAEYRKSKMAYIVSLESQLETLNEQHTSLKEKSVDSKAKFEDSQSKINALNEKIRQLQYTLLEQEESFKTELSAQIRLSELYKEAVEESKERIDEMESIQKNTDALYFEKEAELKIHADEWQQKYQQIQKKLEQREEDLRTIQQYIDTNYRSDSPNSSGPSVSASVSKINKSGKSFSEIYSDLLKCQQDLLNEKHEKERIKEMLDSLLNEVEGNAPTVQQQAAELKAAKADIANLLLEINSLKEDKEVSDAKLKSAQEILHVKERELKFKEKQISDLSRQIQVLLGEIEGADGANSDADEVTERLVDFKNVRELQEKNQELLCIIRELSDRLENSAANDKQFSEADLSAQIKLQELYKELETLKEARKKQSEIIESFLQSKPTDQSNDGSNRIAFNNLKDDFDFYKQEKSVLLNELNEKLSECQKECSTLRLDSFKAKAQVEILSEKNAYILNRLSSATEEVSKLQQKNEQLANSIVTFQQKLQQSLDELMCVKSENFKNVSKISVVQSELEMVKSTLIKANEEKNAIFAEKDRLSSLLSNLQLFQLQISNEDAEGKKKLAAQLESAENELSCLRTKFSTEIEYTKSLMHNFEKEKSEYTKRLGSLNDANNLLNKDLALCMAQKEELQQKVESLSNQLSTADKRISLLLIKSDVKLDDETAEMSESTNQKIKATLNRLHEELKLAKVHNTEYQTLLKENEKALKETNVMVNEQKAKLQQITAKYQADLEAIQNELDASKLEIVRLNHQIISLEESKISILRETEESREKIANYDALNEQFKQKEEFYSEKLQNIQKEIDVVHQKYELEVVNHAKDIEKVGILKKELECVKTDFSTYKTGFEQENVVNMSKIHSLEIEKNNLTLSLEETQFRLTDLNRQNEILFSQLEAFAKQNIKMPTHEKEDGIVSGSTGVSSQMDEVVKFLRKEKEILSCKNDILVQENKRFKLSAEKLTTDLNNLQKQFEEFKAESEYSAKMKAEYESVLKKIEDLNVLRESNSVLRSECDKLKNRLKESENACSKLQAEFSPLSDKNKLLNAQTEALRKDIANLEIANKQWKDRVEQLIARTDTVDAETHKQTKAQLDEAEAKKVEALANLASLTSEHCLLQEKYSSLEERSKKLALLCQTLKSKVAAPKAAGSDVVSNAASEEKLKALNDQIKQLTDKIAIVEAESLEKEEKIKKLTAIVLKTNQLKSAYSKLSEELKVKEANHERQISDLKKEHELHLALLNSKFKNLSKKSTESPELKQANVAEPDVSQQKRKSDGAPLAAHAPAVKMMKQESLLATAQVPVESKKISAESSKESIKPILASKQHAESPLNAPMEAFSEEESEEGFVPDQNPEDEERIASAADSHAEDFEEEHHAEYVEHDDEDASEDLDEEESPHVSSKDVSGSEQEDSCGDAEEGEETAEEIQEHTPTRDSIQPSVPTIDVEHEDVEEEDIAEHEEAASPAVTAPLPEKTVKKIIKMPVFSSTFQTKSNLALDKELSAQTSTKRTNKPITTAAATKPATAVSEKGRGASRGGSSAASRRGSGRGSNRRGGAAGNRWAS